MTDFIKGYYTVVGALRFKEEHDSRLRAPGYGEAEGGLADDLEAGRLHLLSDATIHGMLNKMAELESERNSLREVAKAAKGHGSCLHSANLELALAKLEAAGVKL